jgi:hypothetical protein
MSEMALLFEACLEILTLFLFLLGDYHLCGVPLVVGFSICVHHPDVNDIIHAACLEAAQKDISSIILTCRLVSGNVCWTSTCSSCSTAWANQGFVADHRRSKYFSSQVYQLVSDFIVSENHEATILASKGMLQDEASFTTITGIWEAGW